MSRLSEALQPGFRALKRNWAPFLVIQLGAGALVWLYYAQPAVQQWADGVAHVKTSWGLAFSFLAGAIAGGLIPEVAKLITGRLKRPDRKWMGQTMFNAFAYGIIASQVDLFYRLQAYLFGHGVDLQTLAIKTAVDMGLFAPIVSMPTAILLFEWRKAGYSWTRAFQTVPKGDWLSKWLAALLPCWGFWIPVLFAVYAMPTNLQFPLSVLAEAAWSIVFVFIATEDQTVSLENAS